tara:strand:- start:5535 stop:6563 length:1029 start_codon:yes stop_codon:yes gene_type:complete
MKVLQVIDQLGIGGAERVAIDMTNLLHEAGITVSFLALLGESNQDRFIIKDVQKIYLQRKSKFNPRILFRLRTILKEFDIVHVHMRHNFRYVQLVSKIFRLKSKIILHDHFGSIQIDKSIPLFLNSILKPNYYIGVSNDLTAWCRTVLGIKENVFLLQNIIIKQHHSKKINPKGMVVLGNIKPIKNQLFAIELAHFLEKDLTIIGQVQDEAYFQLLQDKVQDLGIEPKITFVHDENNPQKHLNEFEVGLMTSKSESGPLVLVEYLAQSLPFVSFNTGAVSNILADDLPYSFVNSFELSVWKKSMDSICISNLDYKYLYNTYFSPSKYSQECIAIYKDTLKDS